MLYPGLIQNASIIQLIVIKESNDRNNILPSL